MTIRCGIAIAADGGHSDDLHVYRTTRQLPVHEDASAGLRRAYGLRLPADQ